MASIAANIITKNGANACLDKTIESIKPYVDDIIVCDTGSTDNTEEILKKHNLDSFKIDLTKYGQVWKDKKACDALVKCYYEMRLRTNSDWILKVDDDEIFPKELMKEILEEIKCPQDMFYTLTFKHYEKKTGLFIDPTKHPGLCMVRIFLNLPCVGWRGRWKNGKWNGIYICRDSKPIVSGKCPKLKNSFLHLGELRKSIMDREHNYKFHRPGHCGLKVSDEYRKYID